jgi:hypothetical protein
MIRLSQRMARAILALELADDAFRARPLRSLPAPWQSKPAELLSIRITDAAWAANASVSLPLEQQLSGKV